MNSLALMGSENTHPVPGGEELGEALRHRPGGSGDVDPIESAGVEATFRARALQYPRPVFGVDHGPVSHCRIRPPARFSVSPRGGTDWHRRSTVTHPGRFLITDSGGWIIDMANYIVGAMAILDGLLPALAQGCCSWTADPTPFSGRPPSD